MKKSGVFACTGVLAALLVLNSVVLAGNTITVCWDGSGDYTTIQAAIDDCNNGDTVIVANGTYTGSGNRDIDFNGKAITLKSENGPENCIIDCQQAVRGFYFHNGEDANSILDGFTITNGIANSGGGIYNQARPTIKNCIFINNSATGISHGSGGGGMKNNGGSPIVIDCKFIGNSASGGEAGSGGGGIFNNSGNLKLINCIFTGNSSGHYGGAMFNNSSPIIANCTFSNNSATKDGGGILTYISNAKPKLTNCIFWGNTDIGGTDEGAQIHFGNPVVNYCCIQGLTGGLGGTGNIGDDPSFVDVDGVDGIAGTLDDDLHLPFDSPCIDAGSTIWPDLLPEKDLDGNFRQADGDNDGVVAVDMGVYEYGTVETPLISAQPAQFEFITRENESDVPAQTLFIWNLGIDTLNWQISEDCPWLDVFPLSGSSSGEFNEVSLSVDVSNMLPGDYDGVLIVSDEEADNSPVTVSLTLRIGGVVRHVPSDYPTIQAAINDSIDGDTVIVADDIYTGPGNRDIYFGGRAITVKSKNGPENCIIDCENDDRGFYFHHGEDANSVLNGFTITNGRPYDNGGGIHCYMSSPKITNCVISGNSITAYTGNEGRGGGIYCGFSSPIISNCVISNNTVTAGLGSEVWGGGMYNYMSNPTIINCTFTGNSANSLETGGWEAYGGGIYNTDCSPNLVNCIFWGNSTDGGFGESEQIDGRPPVINYCCIQGWTGALGGIGNIGNDPCFINPNNGDYHLLAGSPCIDAGDAGYVPEPGETDLDGNPRIVNTIVDMGAYEFGGLVYIDDNAPNDPGPGDPDISDPNENGTEEHPFDTIQEGIDVAQDGYTVLVQPGQYLTADPNIEEQIDFGGKNITLTSINPADPNIVNNTIIGGTVQFDGTEDPGCTLTGFTIRHVGFGRIVGNGTQATISYCNISGNAPCGAMVMAYCDGTISNCLITDNITASRCGVNPVVFGCDGLIKNCTIANNISGVSALDGDTMTLENCIIYDNNGFQLAGGSGATLNVSYCNIQGGAEGIAGEANVNWGPGNIEADPCFVQLGEWDYVSWPWEFFEGDYHLKSEGWRCDAGYNPPRWTYDYVTSRCIDAGNPGSPLGDELTSVPEDPNNIWGKNIRINMGAFGGTAQASMPPYDWALLGDLTNDGIVGYPDLAWQVEDWLTIAKEQPGDLNRDGVVNMVDFAALAEDWLQTTDWAK